MHNIHILSRLNPHLVKNVNPRMAEQEKKCVFTSILESCFEGKKTFHPKPLSERYDSTVIESSKERGGGFATNLKNQNSDFNLNISTISLVCGQ